MSLKNADFIVLLLSIVCGTLLGEWIQLSTQITVFVDKLKNKLHIQSHNFSKAIITAFLLFCVGSMTIVGAIDEGLGKPASILYTKSIMDGISAIILASTLGVGVLFSVSYVSFSRGYYYSSFLL